MLRTLLIFSFLSLSFLACKNTKSGPNLDGIDDSIQIVRYDDEIRKLDTLNLGPAFENLDAKYPAITDLYFSQIIPIRSKTGEVDTSELRGFLTDQRIRLLLDTVAYEFRDFREFENDFKKFAQHFRFYFPTKSVPNFYTIISEFGFQNFIFDDKKNDGIGIGLDFFLGENYPYKALDPTNPSFSDYMTRTYNKDHLLRKSVSIAIGDLIGPPNGKRLIDIMINEGKKLYVTEKLIPFVHDTIIMEYSAQQLEWAQVNELEMWSYFLDKNLLYETNHLKINRYINPAPNSHGMPKESPGRTALFIGRQIIKKYMDKFPKLSLDELLSEFDAQKILEASKYKPKRK